MKHLAALLFLVSCTQPTETETPADLGTAPSYPLPAVFVGPGNSVCMPANDWAIQVEWSKQIRGWAVQAETLLGLR